MARRRGEEDEGVSLFPFLSIIACVIGVLTLLISTLSLAQMGSNENVAELEYFEDLQRDLKELQEEIERLKKQLDEDALRKANEMDEEQRALAAARQRLDQLLKRIIELRKLLEQLQQNAQAARDKAADAAKAGDAMRDELTGLKEQITKLQEDLASHKEQIAQLEKELDERKKPPKESEVSVLPSGSGLGFKPVFAECTGGSVVLHQADKQPRIRAADLAQNEDFLKLLSEVAASPKTTLVFLIRDNGLGTYHTARGLADEHEARNGKLPVIGQGRLDLSYFTKSE
jgi:uncharacterized membrane protein (DUF106 family)